MNYSYYSFLLDNYRRRTDPECNMLSIRKAIHHSYQNEASRLKERCRQEQVKQRRAKIENEREISTQIRELKRKEKEIGTRFAHIKGYRSPSPPRRGANTPQVSRRAMQREKTAITVYLPSMTITKAGENATQKASENTKATKLPKKIPRLNGIDLEAYTKEESDKKAAMDVYKIPKVMIHQNTINGGQEHDVDCTSAYEYEKKLLRKLGREKSNGSIKSKGSKHNLGVPTVDISERIRIDTTPEARLNTGRKMYIEKKYFNNPANDSNYYTSDKYEDIMSYYVQENGLHIDEYGPGSRDIEPRAGQYYYENDEYGIRAGPREVKPRPYELLIVDQNAPRTEEIRTEQHVYNNSKAFDILRISEKDNK